MTSHMFKKGRALMSLLSTDAMKSSRVRAPTEGISLPALSRRWYSPRCHAARLTMSVAGAPLRSGPLLGRRWCQQGYPLGPWRSGANQAWGRTWQPRGCRCHHDRPRRGGRLVARCGNRWCYGLDWLPTWTAGACWAAWRARRPRACFERQRCGAIENVRQGCPHSVCFVRNGQHSSLKLN